MPTLHPRPLRRLATLACTFAATAALVSTGPTATAQSTPDPHWGLFKWDGQAASVRAFWLFDRTGDADTRNTIRAVVGAWNSARADHPELPVIGIYQDDANVGRCFVNRTAGYSVASACMMPQDIHGVKAVAGRHTDGSGHLLGAAFAVAEGLNPDERLTVVCHAFGHVMGLEDSENEESCMFPQSNPDDDAKWYDGDDATAILDLYDHDDTPAASTTTTSAPTSTSTTVGSTTTTSAPTTTSTTIASSTTTSTVASTTTTTAGLDLCDVIPLPVGCEE